VNGFSIVRKKRVLLLSNGSNIAETQGEIKMLFELSAATRRSPQSL